MLDLAEGLGEELVKPCAERGIVRGNRGQHTGMIKGSIQPALQFAHSRNNAGIDQRIEIAIAGNLFPQRIEVPQQLHMFFGSEGTSVSARISIRAISNGESGSAPSSP